MELRSCFKQILQARKSSLATLITKELFERQGSFSLQEIKEIIIVAENNGVNSAERVWSSPQHISDTLDNEEVVDDDFCTLLLEQPRIKGQLSGAIDLEASFFPYLEAVIQLLKEKSPVKKRQILGVVNPKFSLTGDDDRLYKRVVKKLVAEAILVREGVGAGVCLRLHNRFEER